MQKCRLSMVVCWMFALVTVAACGPGKVDEDDHQHHHHHGSTTPHGGHLIELEPADYVAEWTHDDKTAKLTIYILDRAGEQEAAIAAETVKIVGEKKIGGSAEPVAFEHTLTAVHASAEEPAKASRFENSKPDPYLITDVKMGTAVSAMLEFEVNGQKYQGAIEHEHHDH